MELEELILVSCVMCDVTTRCQALGVFSENYRKRVVLSTLNVKMSESEVIFPLKFRHCSSFVAHYKLVLALHFNFKAMFTLGAQSPSTIMLGTNLNTRV